MARGPTGTGSGRGPAGQDSNLLIVNTSEAFDRRQRERDLLTGRSARLLRGWNRKGCLVSRDSGDGPDADTRTIGLAESLLDSVVAQLQPHLVPDRRRKDASVTRQESLRGHPRTPPSPAVPTRSVVEATGANLFLDRQH